MITCQKLWLSWYDDPLEDLPIIKLIPIPSETLTEFFYPLIVALDIEHDEDAAASACP